MVSESAALLSGPETNSACPPAAPEVMAEPLNAGDRVEVMVTERLAWKAVLLAYILPFVVMMAVIGLLNLWIESEAVVGTVALCAIALYYIVLSFFRGRLQKEFSFTARKI